MGILTLGEGVTIEELKQEGFYHHWEGTYIYEHYIQFNGRKRQVYKIFYWPESFNKGRHLCNKAIVRYNDRCWNSNPKYYEISDIGDLKILIHLAKEGKAED